MSKKPKGRPRKIQPFFKDPEEEKRRVEMCKAEGRDPYPPFKHEACDAERDLRRDIMPGVPLDLVLQLNDTDNFGRPVDHPNAIERWDDAATARSEAAIRGGKLRPRTNLAQKIVYEEREYIKASRAKGMTENQIRLEIERRRKLGNKPCAGRSQMYEALKSL